jgi:hypothetical protein
MKTENFAFTHKRKKISGVVVWPETLLEAVHLLGEKEVWKAFRLGYLELVKKRMINPTPRRQIRKIDLSSLPEEYVELIDQILNEHKVQKNPPPLMPQTFQTDFAEKPAAEEVQSSPSDDSFEADFAKYSAALDSSLQPPTGTDETQPGTTEYPHQSIRSG